MRLPTHDTVAKTVPDAMHTVRDSIVHLFYLIIGKEYSENVRLAEKELKRGLECSTSAWLGKRKTSHRRCYTSIWVYEPVI